MRDCNQVNQKPAKGDEMGCDIHSLIQGQWLHTDHGGKEIKTPDSTCWHTTQEGFHERDYELFGYLAGVRNSSITPICEPRGLPNDFLIADGRHPLPLDFNFDADSFRRPDVQAPWWYDMGEHTYTWFAYEELRDAGKVKLPDGVEKENHILEVWKMAKTIRNQGIKYPDYKNWRIVIGFDS